MSSQDLPLAVSGLGGGVAGRGHTRGGYGLIRSVRVPSCLRPLGATRVYLIRPCGPLRRNGERIRSVPLLP